MSDRKTPKKQQTHTETVRQPFPFGMAFQPIVDVQADAAYAYEALVRGPGGESAESVLRQVTPESRYAFDQSSQIRALTLATELGFLQGNASISLNFLPAAVSSSSDCVQLSLDTVERLRIPNERVIFEIVETDDVLDLPHMRGIVDDYRQRGFRIAIDDFGAGHASLQMLADFPADIIKLDMSLIRNVHERKSALAIVKSLTVLAETLGCDLIAEGVETVDEYDALRECGIWLMQGYLFARPAFESLPAFSLPGRKAA